MGWTKKKSFWMMFPWKFGAWFYHNFGGSGAGKSTLFNTIAGTLPGEWWEDLYFGEDVTNYSPWKRAKVLIAGLFKILKWAQRLAWQWRKTLLVAKFRGGKRGLIPRHLASYKEEFKTVLAKIGNGLENHIDTAVEFLSGGNDKPWVCWWWHWNVQNSCF